MKRCCFCSKARLNREAFTLIELLVVVLIIGILAAVALPQYQLSVKKARISTFLPLLASIKNIQETHFLEEGEYVADLRKLNIDIPKDCTIFNATTGLQWTCGTDIFLENGGEGSTKAAGYISVFYCPGYSANWTQCVNHRDLSIYFYYNHPLRTSDIPKAGQKNCEVKNSSNLGKRLCHMMEAAFTNVYD